jgi:hypothetical protein
MLKPISVIIGCLSIFAIASKSDAMMANSQSAAIDPVATNLHSQVILKIGDRAPRYGRDRGYSRGSILQQRRNLERQRDREADRRDRSNDGYYHRDRPNDGYYRRDR